jgi:NagD protein
MHGLESGNLVYTIGEAGLTTALHEAGFILTDQNPDFVVLGETRTYSFQAITTAIRMILAGARFIATNPDTTAPSRDGPIPGMGAVAALITKATGREPYIVGEPNPMMFRSAMNRIKAHARTTAVIGDLRTPTSSPASKPDCGPCWSSAALRARTTSPATPSVPTRS